MGDTPGGSTAPENGATLSLDGGDAVSPYRRVPARSPEVLAGSLTAGFVLGKRYTIERLVGKGGMGAVYLAIDDVLGKDVALKVVNERYAGDFGRLRNEVLLAHEVTHRNVCRTHDLEEVDGHWLVKMEYIDGETLADRVAAGGRLAIPEACAIARQIAVGLAAAHVRGVVHRDLKPQNILIERDTDRVVLMDFGLARLSELAGLCADGVAGTPEFMAPEQARGLEVDGRADLYALGCVLHYMLTGQTVFPGKTGMAAAMRHAEDPPPEPRGLRPDIPAWLAQLILRLLEKDPERRPADAAQVATALDGPPRRARRIAVLGLLAAAFGGVVWLLARPQPEWRPLLRDIVPTYEESAKWVSFSPDGKLIAYMSDRDNGGIQGIHVDSLADGSSRIVSPPGVNMWRPRWTRDGRAILAVAPSMTEIYRLPIDGGPPELLARSAIAPEDCNGRLLFIRMDSPDCYLCSRIVLREPDGGERDLVRFTAKEMATVAHCDRAGRRVVYTVISGRHQFGTRQRSDLWIVSLDGGSPRQLTTDGLGNHHGSFHPDGKSIVFTSARTGANKLWELPLSGGPPEQLTFGAESDANPDVSPDGRMVAYELDFGSAALVAYTVPGGVRRKLSSRSEALSALQMTPDGNEIIAAAVRGTEEVIVAIDTRQGTERTVVGGLTPAVSPDGREIFYSVHGSPTRVLAVPRTGGAPRPVTEVSHPIRYLGAGADGQLHMWVLGDERFEAWRAPLSGGASEREAPAPWAWIVPAPAGGWRLGLAYDGAPSIVEGAKVSRHYWPQGAALDDPAARVRVHEGPGWEVWDTNGQSVVYMAGSKVGRFFPASGEDVVLFDTGIELWMKNFAVSPDGNTIYLAEFVSHTRRKLITNFGDRPRPR
jgi:serine/threonine protein kinase